ncbi:hypothetical protein ISS06_00250 [Patescibacteria group bacterium]|nr:hypothetical protein [Patescibacteria group bacterium]
MVILTIICWALCLLVLVFINPWKTGLNGYVLFYASLFLAIIGTLALLGFVIRAKIGKKKPVFKQVEVSFRQAIWTSFLIIGVLILLSLRILRWWNFLFMILFFIALELFFLTSSKKYKYD